MEKKIPFTIKEDIYDKFCLALNLSKEDEEQAGNFRVSGIRKKV